MGYGSLSQSRARRYNTPARAASSVCRGQYIYIANTHCRPGRLRPSGPTYCNERISGALADPETRGYLPRARRILAHHLHRIGTVGLEDAHRARRPHPVAVQEHHDLAHDLLFRPRVPDALGAHRADALDLTQPLGRLLDDVEHLLAKRAHQLLRIHRPDATDHSRAEVALDAFDRSRRRNPQELRPELLPVGAIVHPLPGGGDPLARRDARGMADGGHEIPVPARLHARHTEAAVRVVERYAFDQTGERFPGWRRRRRFRMPTHRKTIQQAGTAVKGRRLELRQDGENLHQPRESLGVALVSI
jgi:hypothetical protein